MAGIRLLICDTDSKYLDALVEYIVGSRYGHETVITTYHDVKHFMSDDSAYNIGLLSKDFNSDMKCHLQRQLYLSEEKEDGEETNVVYKYQNMDNLMGKVFRQGFDGKLGINESGRQELVAVFSPIFHELRLPFALSLCKVFSAVGDVLFVDLEQISIFNKLMGKENDKDLLDYLYLKENEDFECDLYDYLESFEGFTYLPPMSSPAELPLVSPKQWFDLINDIKKSDFNRVVFLFDGMLQGIFEMLECCSKVIILERPGDFYDLSSKEFVKQLKKGGLSQEPYHISLAMSANGLNDGEYQLNHLLSGNLGDFVKKEVTKLYA